MKEETLKSMCPPTGQATRVRRFCPGPRRWKLCPALLFHFSLTDTAERPEGTPRSFRRVALVRMEAPDAGKQWVGVDWATEVFWPEMECRLWRVAAAEMKNLKIARDLVPSVSFGSNKKTYTAAAVHGELFVLFDVLVFLFLSSWIISALQADGRVNVSSNRKKNYINLKERDKNWIVFPLKNVKRLFRNAVGPADKSTITTRVVNFCWINEITLQHLCRVIHLARGWGMSAAVHVGQKNEFSNFFFFSGRNRRNNVSAKRWNVLWPAFSFCCCPVCLLVFIFWIFDATKRNMSCSQHRWWLND